MEIRTFIRTVHADNFLCLSAYRYRPPVSGIDKLPHWLRIQNVLYVSLPGTQTVERERCIQELKRLPNVSGVTWGYQEMFMKCSGNNVYDPQSGKEYMNIADMYDVGSDYHKVFSIPVLEGSTFTTELGDSASQEVMVSRNFIKQMEKLAGWTGSPVGKQVLSQNIKARTLSVVSTKKFI